VLDRAADDLTALRDLLAVQLAELDARARQTTLLRRRINDLLEQLTAATMPDPDQFMAALEMGSIAATHFTSEQLDFLLSRGHEMGEEAVEALRAEALDLLARIRRHQQGGTPVDDPRVQELTVRLDAIGTAFHDGDQPLIAAANAVWSDNRVEISRRLGWPTDGPDIVDYLHRARQVRRDSAADGARPRDGA
jgi:MerR family transcriptional regulator, thiopeptide resistance regulator